MMENWKRGRSIIQYGDTTIGKTIRLLSVDIEIKTLVKLKSKTKLKHKCISLLTSYHPTSSYSEKEVSKFNNEVLKMISSLPKDIILIMGADLNASISIRSSETRETRETNDFLQNEDPSTSLLGPHGNARRNARGELIIGVMNHLQLRVASTFFVSKKNQGHDTWTHPTTKEYYQLDHFLIKHRHLQLITNIKKKVMEP